MKLIDCEVVPVDIDFHFGTVYVLSRWAGFGSESSKLIATSSQYVDDNIDNRDGDKSSSRDTGYDVAPDGRIIRYSGHELWDNLWSKDGNEEIWIPYHFLPGLVGETEEEKLICKKHSILSKELKNRLSRINYQTDSNYCFNLGVGLHVFADTWAHQEFSGVPSLKNIVKDLAVDILNKDNWSSISEILDLAKSSALNLAYAPLGHAAAIHWPDKPYARWKSSKFPDGRDNCKEFLEAAEECYEVLAAVSGDRPPQLDDDMREMLRNAFMEIRDDEGADRNAVWLEWIRNNAFGFDDFDEGDENIDYDMDFIMGDADFHDQFFDAVNDYYLWCQSRLEENGIKCVGYFEGGDKSF